jgi:DNA-binding SARP family transcriptional activator
MLDPGYVRVRDRGGILPGGDREIAVIGREKIAATAELELLGGFRLIAPDGSLCSIPSAKLRGLLAMLALARDGALSPEAVISRLWSDRGESQGRDSLKHACATLRRHLGPMGREMFDTGRTSVSLDLQVLEVDVRHFERLAHSENSEEIAAGVNLYKGDLLDGIVIRDGAFEDWLARERRRLGGLAEDALARLVANSEARDDGALAETAARRLLDLDPFREEAVRALMRCHSQRGERGLALRLYADFGARLTQELQTKPDPLTDALEKSIRVGTVRPPLSGSLPLPDRPSIAVLRVENLRGDPTQA